ncbi:hypothetical protein [Allonocardiopsis opalescens]|uniref:ATP/GTP-binding protein n=1 Tax=Allonocardiopsis opalescens TaxID=1144618 RepID=A0A2T0QCX4_9ACTN|nr:hypothetical protein [Allonocardiopsis opalescens]PRY01804.1 hypothetical protein CLV72_101400 [Allonocardiopsis opalescens]
MSPRRNARRRDEPPPTGRIGGIPRAESGPDGDWVVRAVTGAAADKTYVCPGCEQRIGAGVPHTVAWPSGDRGAENRRHWHTSCWTNRLNRGPRVRRSRDAPRY